MNRKRRVELVALYKPADPDQYLGVQAKWEYYEIISEDRLYLRVNPHHDPFFDSGEEQDEDGSRARFCTVFRTAWFKIESPYRGEMLAEWQAGAPGMPWLPQIGLVDDEPKIGAYQSKGSLVFNSGAAHLLDEVDLLADLIGHELAHAWHDTRPDSHIRRGGTRKQVEDEANELADAWGFRMQALKDWANAHKPQLEEHGVYVGGDDDLF